jgi:hypothetical protein
MKNRHVFVAIAFASAAVISGCGSDSNTDEGPIPLTVSKATCGASDKPETALQGQVPAAMRASGFTGFNCNLHLVGQLKGEGGNWSTATLREQSTGKACAYHSTSVPNATRVNPGVPVIDISNPASPRRTTSLTTPAMLDPWESLRVNARRKILVADNGQNGGGGAEIDIYDLSGDCTNPQLLSSTKVGLGADGTVTTPRAVIGHEGGVAPDGLTYYIGNTNNGMYHAVDITSLAAPKVLATFDMRSAANPVGGGPHGLSVSADGNRMYGVVVGATGFLVGTPFDPQSKATNGFLILDTSEVQARKANPQIKVAGFTVFKDGSIAQHTIPIKIAGKPYVVMVDEGGSAGLADPQGAFIKAAAAAGLTPFPAARIFDISDEKNPKAVSKLLLEIHDPANGDKVAPDLAGLSIFTYGSHYCSVDNRENATALACSYFNSGIRVFDIRKPERPREIAYLNPPATTGPPGSAHAAQRLLQPGGPDWCASRLDFDFATGTLTTMCQDNGLMIMKFDNNAWPFPESTASTDQN